MINVDIILFLHKATFASNTIYKVFDEILDQSIRPCFRQMGLTIHANRVYGQKKIGIATYHRNEGVSGLKLL